jgi:hypothetical protein
VTANNSIIPTGIQDNQTTRDETGRIMSECGPVGTGTTLPTVTEHEKHFA